MFGRALPLVLLVCLVACQDGGNVIVGPPSPSPQSSQFQVTAVPSPPVSASDPTPKTCKDRFAWWDLKTAPEAGTAVATFELSGWDDGKLPGYHFACFSPPGQGAGVFVRYASGDSSPLLVDQLRRCDPMVYQCDLGCGFSPPQNASYNGGSFAGHVNVSVPALPPGQCQECPWVTQKPEITYGEWSACSQDKSAPQCHRSRSVTTRIYEVNSCTEERRLVSEETHTETEPCACPTPTPPPCEVDGEPDDCACLDLQPGEEECKYLGLTLLRKIDTTGDPSQIVAAMDAAAVMIKDGRGQCDQHKQSYRIYVGVHAGDVLLKPSCGGAISHVSYCQCDED